MRAILIRTRLLAPAIATALLFAAGSLLHAAPVVRLCQTQTVKSCGPLGCRTTRQQCWASGTVIGRDAEGRLLVLTCAHGWIRSSPIGVEIDSTPEPGEFLSLDTARDLALIGLRHDGDVPAYPIADAAPAAGTLVTVQGYPHAGRLRTRETRVKRYAGNDLITAAPFANGESGGAVIVANRIVGVISATNHVDGYAAHTTALQTFVLAAVGQKPAGAAAVPALLPVPHPEPLPAPRLAPDPNPVEPLPTLVEPLPTRDDIREIVTSELSKLAPGVKAELVTQLGLHAADLKQAVTASVAAGKLDPAEFTPIFQSAAKSAAADVGQSVAEKVAPSLLAAVASHLGAGALAGSIGGPIGAAVMGGMSLVGFFLNRTLKNKQFPAALGPLAPASAGQPGPLVRPFPVAVESPPAPQAIIPSRTFQQIEVDRTAAALDWAYGELVKKYPGSEGTISTLQSLVSQYRSGAQAPAP